jgi:hypothetical protein
MARCRSGWRAQLFVPAQLRGTGDRSAPLGILPETPAQGLCLGPRAGASHLGHVSRPSCCRLVAAATSRCVRRGRHSLRDDIVKFPRTLFAKLEPSVPVDPSQGSAARRPGRAPRSALTDQLGLVQAVHGLGEGFVLVVALGGPHMADPKVIAQPGSNRSATPIGTMVSTSSICRACRFGLDRLPLRPIIANLRYYLHVS